MTGFEFCSCFAMSCYGNTKNDLSCIWEVELEEVILMNKPKKIWFDVNVSYYILFIFLFYDYKVININGNAREYWKDWLTA